MQFFDFHHQLIIQACIIIKFSYFRFMLSMMRLLDYTSECQYYSDINILLSNNYIASINQYAFLVSDLYRFKLLLRFIWSLDLLYFYRITFKFGQFFNYRKWSLKVPRVGYRFTSVYISNYLYLFEWANKVLRATIAYLFWKSLFNLCPL